MTSSIELLMPTRLMWAVSIIALSLMFRFLQRLHYHRSLVKGLPGPPHNYILGSLRSMGEVIAKQPKRAAPQTYPLIIKDHYKLGDYFAMDPWPFGPTMLVVLDPDMIHEMTVKQSQPKHPEVEMFMQNFGGDSNLVSAEGATWKKWRSAFNPGFSAAHLMTMVPVIVDECAVFSEVMAEHAKKNDLFRMERAATRLTVDIIGRVVLDHALNSQRTDNELVSAFVSQTRWQRIGVQFNPIELIDFRIPIVQRYNTWRMDRYIGRCLDERFATRGAREQMTGGKRQKHVIDLALEAYLKEVKNVSGSEKNGASNTIDPTFRKAAIANVKTFVFAGHDTTSSTITYAFYYLSKTPSALSQIRAEHDSVFGPDPSTAAQRLKESPHLLNNLPYTTAVIKEVLRIQPPASTVRLGSKGFFLHDPKTGELVHTEGLMLWPVDVALHRDPSWGDPHVFRPERFLSSSSAETNPRYVPFSKGNRNCIGQELAMIETKVILAMTCRSWEFESCYAELGLLRGDGSGYPSDEVGVQRQFGEEAYQIQLGTAKPREGMPCRLRLRE